MMRRPAGKDEPRKRVLLISPNVGEGFGGEAIKVFQYAAFLRETGRPFQIVAHERSRREMEGAFAPAEFRLIADDAAQRLMWRLRPLRGLIHVYFNWKVRRLVRRDYDPAATLLHYMAPVSPVTVRLQPRGFETVIGPLTGNIYYPPAFAARMPARSRRRQLFHNVSQVVLGRIFGDKRRADVVLVSGYERTRASLRLAGCRDAQMLDVVDAGVSPRIAALPRIRHQGRNAAFLCTGRMDDHKAVDLAIRAVAGAPDDIRLDIAGGGAMRGAWEALAQRLGLAERVRFLGWLPYDELIARLPRYRGFVFPSLAEANGIAMQEAMMVGLPVVTLRWGGPAHLADDRSAIFVEPDGEAAVVKGISDAMARLADDDALAENLSRRAREIAEARYAWPVVAASWAEAYRRPPA